jgi:hypothetical protein
VQANSMRLRVPARAAGPTRVVAPTASSSYAVPPRHAMVLALKNRLRIVADVSRAEEVDGVWPGERRYAPPPLGACPARVARGLDRG